ncbi:34778_t:CDS:1, partial [Racocetra persica]
AVLPSTQQPTGSPLVLNNNMYIFNTQNYTWVNTFDASNINGSNPTNSDDKKDSNDSILLGAKIGIGIGVLVALILIGVAGFFIYKKIRSHDHRHSIATPGSLYTEYTENTEKSFHNI